MSYKPPRPNDGPIFRTLREILALPLEQRLDAFVDRLDLLDQDELAKVYVSKSGESYPQCNNSTRLKILDVGKQWLHDAEKQGYGANNVRRFAALKKFDAQPKKAAG
jgi:hypothetical protein